MFADLDDTIRQLLIRDVPLNSTEVDISFEAPDREWSGRLTRPTVNCFLYDVRENHKFKITDYEIRRDGTNNTAIKTKGPVRIDATYQVTVWSRVPEDEHRLLWRVLAALIRHPTMPNDLLQGQLRAQPMPMLTWVAQPEQMPANFADLWQALDNRIRPTLTFVVTLALDPAVVHTSPLVLQRAPVINLDNVDRRAMAESLQVRGRVRDSQDPTKSVTGALVLLQETGDGAVTDDEGRFMFARAPRGPITLIVRAPGRAEVSWPVTVPAASYELEV